MEITTTNELTNLLPQPKLPIPSIPFVPPTARLQLLDALPLGCEFGAVGGFLFQEAGDGVCGDGDGGRGGHWVVLMMRWGFR